MRVVIISHCADSGGAAKSARRLHDSLLTRGLDSFLVYTKGSKVTAKSIGPKSAFSKFLGLIRPTLDSLPNRFYFRRRNRIFSTNYLPNKSLTKIVNHLKPDVINIHWIGSGTQSISELNKLNAPLVFKHLAGV